MRSTRHLHDIKSLVCNGTATTASTDISRLSYNALKRGGRSFVAPKTARLSHLPSIQSHTHTTSQCVHVSSRRNLSSAVHVWQECTTKDCHGLQEDYGYRRNVKSYNGGNDGGETSTQEGTCTCQDSLRTTLQATTFRPLDTNTNDHQPKLYHNPHHTQTENDETHMHDDQSICNNECHDEYKEQNIPFPSDIDLESPPPDPRYSFHRRVLPQGLTQFSSPEGRILFQEALASNYAESYFPLAEQFLSQSDPAYCGVTSLIMVLNAFGIDPNVRWKGGWRWYGCEDMILENCCIDRERVQRVGILMKEFQSLGRCQGLNITLKRPTRTLQSSSSSIASECYELGQFRKDIQTMVRNPPSFEHEESVGGFMVVSFDRASLGQTGDGHFSPIAAYHEESDRCLILDVARFKYAPYWVSVTDLFEATKPLDPTTMQSRGWFMIYPSSHDQLLTSEINDASDSDSDRVQNQKNRFGMRAIDEAKRPADIVPLSGTGTSVCPIGDIKITYCSVKAPSTEQS